jgi:hypothetical protein
MENEEKELLDFEEYCKHFICDKICWYESRKDVEVCACDLIYTLCESICTNGTATMSTDLAIEYIKEWWYDAANYFEYEEHNLGTHLFNPFKFPEPFMVCMIKWGCETLLNQVDVIKEKRKEKIKIDETLITHIKEELEYIDIK